MMSLMKRIRLSRANAVLLLIALVGCVATALVASSAAPPATRPAAPLDLSTPQAALKSFATAWRDADASGLNASLLRGENALKNATFIRWIEVDHRFEKAATARYGKDGVQRLRTVIAVSSMSQRGQALLDDLPGATIAVNGDHATADLEVAGLHELQKVNGEWRVKLPGGENEASPLIGIVERVSADIESGKLKTVDDARAVLAKATDTLANASTEPTTQASP